MDFISNFFNMNADPFNTYLSIGLSILIVVLLLGYFLIWDGFHENDLFYGPLVLAGLCFCIYCSSVGTARTIFGWLFVILCVLGVLSLIAANILEGYGRAFKN